MIPEVDSMPHVTIAQTLKRFFPDFQEQEVPGTTVEEVLGHVEKNYRGFTSYVLDDQGYVRQHVALALNNEFIPRQHSSDIHLSPSDNLYILQALSGG